MLAEWLTRLTAPCQQPYRRMGYLTELIAIRFRHRRCHVAWDPHLKNCRELIRSVIPSCTERQKVIVLGSGNVLDIPLTDLARQFEEVTLIDICHLPATRRLTRRFKNIRLLESDISGVADALDRWLAGPRQSALPDPAIDQTLLNGASYVISANLLAQLPLVPLSFLARQATDIDDGTLSAFARKVIDFHLSLLRSLNCPVTLITETLRLTKNRQQTVGKDDPLFGSPLSYAGEEWWWDVAPAPETGKDIDVRLRMRAIGNLSTAAHTRLQ